jgi:hypothetical protein
VQQHQKNRDAAHRVQLWDSLHASQSVLCVSRARE